MKNITNAGIFIWQYGFCLALFFSGILQAQTQEKTVTGIVTTDSIPLMGVSVTIKDTNKGVITDIDGEYQIQVQPGDILIYSHLGYEERAIQFLNQKEIDIDLQLDATALGTVEITGGYYSLDERTKTGNVAVVGRDQLDQQVIHAPLEALQGRVAGLEIETRTGLRGQAPLVTLRGQGSIIGFGDIPLYIIDGVAVNGEGIGLISQVYDAAIGLDPLATLDPSLIESIEVLKDADATAIYGSRGANGVIIINTKRGQAGKTKFEIQAETGVSWVGKFLKLMNTEQYLEMRREAFANDGMEPTATNAPDLLLWDQDRYMDWQKELIGHHAEFQKYQGTVSGGSQQTSFLLSGSFQKETTVFPGDFGFQDNNLLANINHKSKDGKLNINSSISYGNRKSNLFNVALFVNNGIRLPPNAPNLFDDKGNINWELDDFGNPTFTNPMAGLANPNSIRTQSLQWNGVVKYKFLEHLEGKINIGFNNLNHSERQTNYKDNLNPVMPSEFKKTLVNLKSSSREHIIVEPQLNYDLSIGRHQINSLIGSTFQKNKYSDILLRGQGYFSDSQVGSITAAEDKDIVTDNLTLYRYAALYGRIGYSYNNKYYLNLTGRRDGSSRFGEKNRFGNFGAVGAAWDFYKEEFIIKSLPWLSYGKLRGSYGTSGSDHIGDYQYRDTYSNVFVETGSLSSGGLVPTRLHNSYYQWEKNKKLEVTLNIGLFKDKILLSSGWYRERTGNQLIGLTLPSITGFNSVQGNLPATVENKGLEFSLTTTPFLNSIFKWTSSMNLTIPKNKLIAFPDLESSSFASRLEIGKSLGNQKLYHYTGIDPDTGKYTFEDVNGDGLLNNDDKILSADLSRKFYGGWNNNIQYKNWNLSFLFEFVKQEGMRSFNFIPGERSNMPIEVLDRWQVSNHSGEYQGYTQVYDSGFNDYISSNAYIEDASFIRLKSISLQYRLTSSISEAIGLKQVNIYLNAQNLLTITSYRGYDPQNPQGINLPALTSINLGLKLTI